MHRYKFKSVKHSFMNHKVKNLLTSCTHSHWLYIAQYMNILVIWSEYGKWIREDSTPSYMGISLGL